MHSVGARPGLAVLPGRQAAAEGVLCGAVRKTCVVQLLEALDLLHGQKVVHQICGLQVCCKTSG